jgi:carotenoid cleavage dioxygenase-like enzyme
MANPAYVFHVANAFDAPDGTVVMDVVAYESMFDQNLRGPSGKGALERWTIDPGHEVGPAQGDRPRAAGVSAR